MPAWKREILERRKAKGSGSPGGGGAGAAAEAGPTGTGSQRVNGTEATGGDGGPKTDNGASVVNAAAAGSGSRSFTITTAHHHFGGKRGALASPDLSPLKTNKDAWVFPAAAGDPHADSTAETTGTTEKEGEGPESLVLHDSLGPLQENPFIKLEKERKRRQDRENATRPVQHILELYGSVPGIRTIRAENIIIIESDPDYFTTEAGSTLQQNGVSSYSSLNDLLDRRGNAVTEIRAREVVIYDTALSRSEENLSTLCRSDYDDGSSYETGQGQGRVSRMLQKFDSNYGKLQKKSHSTENLLDLDTSPGGRRRLRPMPQPNLVVPKPHALPPQPGSPVRNLGDTHSLAALLGHQSSRPKPQPTTTSSVSVKDAPSEPPQSEAAPSEPPPSVSSFRQRFEDTSGIDVNHRDETNGPPQLPRPAKESDRESLPVKTKVLRSPDSRRSAGGGSPTAASSPKVQRSAEFEIRPSPRPDLSLIPEGDSQARALANLRLQSRCSFTVIPIRPKVPPSSVPATGSSSPRTPSVQRAAAEVPRVPTAHIPTPAPASVTPPKRQEEEEEEEEKKEVVVAMDRSVRPSPRPTTTSPTSPSHPRFVPTSPSPPQVTSPPPATPPQFAPVSPPAQSPVTSVPHSNPPSTTTTTTTMVTGELLPVTNIDDIEVEHQHQQQHPHAPSSHMLQKKTGKTFTVVPKPPTATTTNTTNITDSLEAPLEPSTSSGGAQPGSTTLATTTPTAPYSQLGSLLKKRYPAVEEIEVIGGYLSLGKSCLAKTGSAGKKVRLRVFLSSVAARCFIGQEINFLSERRKQIYSSMVFLDGFTRALSVLLLLLLLL